MHLAAWKRYVENYNHSLSEMQYSLNCQLHFLQYTDKMIKRIITQSVVCHCNYFDKPYNFLNFQQSRNQCLGHYFSGLF